MVWTWMYVKVAIIPALHLYMCSGNLLLQQCLLPDRNSSFDRVPNAERIYYSSDIECRMNLLCLTYTFLYITG